MSKDALIFISDYSDTEGWRRELNRLMPALDFRVWPETGDKADVKAALVWKHPHGALLQFPNLQIVTNLGAGVDHLVHDKALPKDVVIARLIDPALTSRITEYVILHTLALHRRMPEMLEAQRRAQWRFIRPIEPGACRVGVMGLGNLGLNALRALERLGFQVAGWSRTPKSLEDVSCFAGADQLPKFLVDCDIVISLLPLTNATENLMNTRVFNQMRKGAAFISLGRGATVVDDDLIDALDREQLRHAVLDVFRTEPLPPTHPFWTHRKITITPHNSSVTSPVSAAPGVVEDIRRALAGQLVLGRVDPARGY